MLGDYYPYSHSAASLTPTNAPVDARQPLVMAVADDKKFKGW